MKEKEVKLEILHNSNNNANAAFKSNIYDLKISPVVEFDVISNTWLPIEIKLMQSLNEHELSQTPDKVFLIEKNKKKLISIKSISYKDEHTIIVYPNYAEIMGI